MNERSLKEGWFGALKDRFVGGRGRGPARRLEGGSLTDGSWCPERQVVAGDWA